MDVGQRYGCLEKSSEGGRGPTGAVVPNMMMMIIINYNI